MDSLYKILPIEGKGLGCVASREIKMGTLILEEIPQFVVPGKIEKSEQLSIELVSRLVETFKKMNRSDQEEFLNLHNRFEGNTKLNKFVNMEMSKNQDSSQNLEQAIRIYGIWFTNSYSKGVSIKTSRLNHSCVPNAESVASKIKAVKKINIGDEITINYNFSEIGMKKLKRRKELLECNWGFNCR